MGGPTLNRTEIDGVPVFWADVPGPKTGSLMFHVGRAHEPAAMAGISHLVEHLALAPLTQRDHPHNGLVEGSRTIFYASGTDDELTDFFGRVTSSLGDLPLDRLPMERRILRQESADRDPGIVPRLLWLRFGNAGHGLLGANELGLDWLGPDPVASWARRRMGRRNAVAWFSGEPPSGLRFHLADGEPADDVPLAVVDGLQLPSHFLWEAPGSAVSWLAERSAAAVLTLTAATRRALEVLRFDRGVVYDVLADYDVLDRRFAHVYMGADCQPPDSEAVRDVLLRTLEEIARDGLTEEELRRDVRGYHDSLLVPQSAIGLLDGAALSTLQGRPVDDQEALTAEYEAVTPAATADGLRPALDTLLLASPPPTPDGHRLQPYPGWSTQRIEGREVKPAGWPLRAWKRKDRLVVGDEGLTWSDGLGRHLTVRFDACVAYRHWEGDRREIRAADGFAIRFAPDEWQGGADLVRRVDAAVAPHLVVCGEHGIGGYEDPDDR
jgi:hypothetical protein